MDNIRNIFGIQGQEGKTQIHSGHSGLSKEDIHAFVTALRQSDAAGKTDETAAKIAKMLDGKSVDRAAISKLLQQAHTGKNDELVKKVAALLDQEPEVKPALTSDLTSNASVTVQQDNGSLIDQLKEKFAALGDMTDGKLADFRQEAIKLMKSMGLDNGEIESNLVQLAQNLGSQLTDEQATLLMMPFRPDAPAATAPAIADASLAKPKISGDGPTTPQQLAEQQLHDAAAKTPDAHKAGEAFDAKITAPKPDQQAPAPQDTQATAKPAPQQTASTLALVNSFASGDGDDAGGFDGQQSFGQQGNSFAPTSFVSSLQSAGSAGASSFINYMNGASAASTSSTQMIALQIQHNAETQVDTFHMQLQPEELGKLEIRLKFDHDGVMKAHLVVDKADTLSMLQKDAPQLQRILQGAGLQLDDASLSFNLRQQQRDTGPYNNQGKSPGADAGDEDFMPANAVSAKIAVQGAGYVTQSGVNIMV